MATRRCLIHLQQDAVEEAAVSDRLQECTDEEDCEPYCGVAHLLPVNLRWNDESVRAQQVPVQVDEIEYDYLISQFGSVEKALEFVHHARENNIFHATKAVEEEVAAQAWLSEDTDGEERKGEDEEEEDAPYCGVSHLMSVGLHGNSAPSDPPDGTPDSSDLEIDERFLLEVFGSLEQAEQFLSYAREKDVFRQGA